MYAKDTSDYKVSSVLIESTTFFNDSTLCLILARDDVNVKAKISNSMPIGNSNSFSKYGNVTFISNDLGI